jgi:hypothetical protein
VRRPGPPRRSRDSKTAALAALTGHRRPRARPTTFTSPRSPSRARPPARSTAVSRSANSPPPAPRLITSEHSAARALGHVAALVWK